MSVTVQKWKPKTSWKSPRQEGVITNISRSGRWVFIDVKTDGLFGQFRLKAYCNTKNLDKIKVGDERTTQMLSDLKFAYDEELRTLDPTRSGIIAVDIYPDAVPYEGMRCRLWGLSPYLLRIVWWSEKKKDVKLG